MSVNMDFERLGQKGKEKFPNSQPEENKLPKVINSPLTCITSHAFIDNPDFTIIKTLEDTLSFRRESIEVNIFKRSIMVKGKNRDGEGVFFTIPRLFSEIIPSKSTYHIESDGIILILLKAKPCKWETVHYFHPSVIAEFKRKFSLIAEPLLQKIKIPSNSEWHGKSSETILKECRYEGYSMYIYKNELEVEFNIPTGISRSAKEIIEFVKEELPKRRHYIKEYLWFLAYVVLYQEQEEFVKTHPEIAEPNEEPKLQPRQNIVKNVEAEALKELGNSHFRAKRYEQAIKVYSKAIDIDPSCSSYYLNRAIARYTNSGNVKEIFYDLQYACSCNPFCVKAYLYLMKVENSYQYHKGIKQILCIAKLLDLSNKEIREELMKAKMIENIFHDMAMAMRLKDYFKIFILCEKFFKDFSPLCQKPLFFVRLISICHELGIPCTYEDIDILVNWKAFSFCSITKNHILLLYKGLDSFLKDDQTSVHENFKELIATPYETGYQAIITLYSMREKANEAYDSCRYEESIHLFEGCLKFLSSMSFHGHKTPILTSKLYFKMAEAFILLKERLKALLFVSFAIDARSDFPEAFAMRAELFLEEGEQRYAEEDIEKAIRLSPCNRYRDLLQRTKRGSQSSAGPRCSSPTTRVTIHSKEEALQKSLADCKKEKGNNHFKDGEYEDALRFYTEAISLNPRNNIYFSNRSACHLALKNFQEALNDAETALSLNPHQIKALHRLSKSQIALGHVEEAVKTIDKALKVRPNDSVFKMEMEKTKSLKDAVDAGKTLFENGNYIGAEHQFSEALKLGEGSLNLHLQEIECLFKLDRFGDAASIIESAFKLDPRNSTVLYYVGVSAYQKGEWNKAKKFLKQSLSINPEQEIVLKSLQEVQTVMKLKELGNKAYSKKKLNDALNLYLEGLQTVSDGKYKGACAVFHFNIARVYVSKSNLKAAVESFSSAIGLRRNYVEAYMEKGNCHMELGHFGKAVEDYEALVKVSPSSKNKKLLREAQEKLKSMVCEELSEEDLEVALSKCKENKGTDLLNRGSYKEALKYFSEALSFDPLLTSYIGLYECLINLGQFSSALSDAQKISDLFPDDANGWIRLGVCHRKLGNDEHSIDALEKARELDSKSDAALQEMILSLKLKKCLGESQSALKDNKFEIAEEQFKIASEIAVWNTNFLLERGKCLFYLNQTDKFNELIASLSHELEESSDILCLKGLFSYSLDQKDDALNKLKESLELNPSNLESKKWIERVRSVYEKKEEGNKAFLEKQFAQALRCYKESLTLEPDNHLVMSKLHFNIGLLHKREQEYAEAIASLSIAIDMKKEYVKALDNRAQCYKETREFEKALEDLRYLQKLTSSQKYSDMIRRVEKELEKSLCKDYYEVLGVSRSSSMEDIRKAYKRLAMQYHPDRLSSEGDKATGEIKFKKIGEAYSVLCDPLKRERYDRGESVEEEEHPFPAYFHPFMFPFMGRPHPFFARAGNPFDRPGFFHSWGNRDDF